MRAVVGGVILLASSLLVGCQPQPQVADISEPPPAPMQPACPVVPPQIIEIPVPVPIACQAKPEPERDTTSTRRGGKRKGQVGSQKAAGRGSIKSVQSYPYMADALYQVYVAVNNATTILLQPGEFFHQAVIGDKGKWTTSEIAAGSSAGERGGVVVNCTEPGAQSNLTIAASKRVYLLELHCTATTYHAQVSWTYPAEGGVGVLNGARPHQATTPSLTQMTADAPSTAQYTIKSNREVPWLPTQVYDTGTQGKQTYIVFPPALGTTDAPVLSVRTAEKTQAVVNYRTKQGYWIKNRMYDAADVQRVFGNLGEPVTYYVLDQIADQLELRIGEKKPTVVTITRQPQGA